MELEEAYKAVQVTPEETASIKRYLGFQHTSMNILSDLEPTAYRYLQEAGWLLPESKKDVAEYIQDFVNIYSAMYKESYGRTLQRELIRGTSNKQASSILSSIPQMLSTSTSIDTAKTFCQYQDAALIHFRVRNPVPFLEAENYRGEHSANEHEIILAPFCKVVRNERYGTSGSYTHYYIDLEKPALEEKSPEELDTLLEQVSSDFTQNIADMKEYLHLQDHIEYLDRQFLQYDNPEDKKYISEDRKASLEKGVELANKTRNFKTKLQTLLRGLCKQKELEVDKAKDLIENDRKKKQEEAEKRKAEEQARLEAEQKEIARKALISELSAKITATPENSSLIESAVAQAYEKLSSDSATCQTFAKRLGIDYTPSISIDGFSDSITTIRNNLTAIGEKLQTIQIPDDISLEDVTKLSQELTPMLDGIGLGVEFAKDFPKFTASYREQAEIDIKRQLYIKVQTAIQNAQIAKYKKQRSELEGTKAGLFDTLTGKDRLKEQQLRNLDLKIRLLQNTAPSEQKVYSVRDMLADIYACTTAQFDKVLPPELGNLYELIKSNFEDTENGKFSDKYIYTLAQSKLQKYSEHANLPAVVSKVPRLFGKTKSQIEALDFENEQLQSRVSQATRDKSSIFHPVLTSSDALEATATRLKQIISLTRDKSKEKGEKDKEDTLELWTN